MIICICNRVSDRDIRQCASRGMDFSDIQFELGVGNACGQCIPCAHAVVNEAGACAPITIFKASMSRASVRQEFQPWSSQVLSVA